MGSVVPSKGGFKVQTLSLQVLERSGPCQCRGVNFPSADQESQISASLTHLVVIFCSTSLRKPTQQDLAEPRYPNPTSFG